jgi:hypothetical protein
MTRPDESSARRINQLQAQTPSQTYNAQIGKVFQNSGYLTAVEQLKEEGILPNRTQLRQSIYLNSLIEQDHRFIERRVTPGLGFFWFNLERRSDFLRLYSFFATQPSFELLLFLGHFIDRRKSGNPPLLFLIEKYIPSCRLHKICFLQYYFRNGERKRGEEILRNHT